MRNHFAELLYEAMKSRPEVFLVYGDIGNKLFDRIKHDFPNRYVNAGVAESNMVTISSGLAYAGMVPVCYTINSFLYLKSLEQIKLDLAYPERHVVMVGTGGGISYGELGTSHHSLEDYGVLRTIPNLRVFSPGDSAELGACFESSLETAGPSYLRIGKKESGRIAGNPSSLAGGCFPYRYFGEGTSRLAVISTGTIGLVVSELLSRTLVSSAVDAFSTPELTSASATSLAETLWKYEHLLVIEEHFPLGGLFSLLAEAFAGKAKAPTMHRHGLQHEFITAQGSQSDIREAKGLSPEGIQEKIESLLKQ